MALEQLSLSVDSRDAAWFERICRQRGLNAAGLFARMRLAFEYVIVRADREADRFGRTGVRQHVGDANNPAGRPVDSRVRPPQRRRSA